MHYICNFVRFRFNKNKNTTLKIRQKKQKKTQKDILKTCVYTFIKTHITFFTSMDCTKRPTERK